MTPLSVEATPQHARRGAEATPLSIEATPQHARGATFAMQRRCLGIVNVDSEMLNQKIIYLMHKFNFLILPPV